MGGVYIDIPMVPQVALRDIIDNDMKFMVPRDTPSKKEYLYNAFIASEPKHPCLLNAIKLVVRNVSTRWYGNRCDALSVTGPGVLGKAVNLYFNRQLDTKYNVGYNNDIYILEHLSGALYKGNIKILNTKYNGYHQDRLNLAGPHYHKLYSNESVYCEIITDTIHNNINNDNIPKHIYQTFKNRIVSKNMANVTKSWKVNNPTYNYTFYTDIEQDQFIVDNFGERVVNAYRSLIPKAYRADLWRYCILYIKGGIYSDINTICEYPIDILLNSNPKFILIEDNNSINNVFIASIPQNPILLKIIQQVVENVEKKVYGENNQDITGSSVMAKTINHYLNRDIYSSFSNSISLKDGIIDNIMVLKHDIITNGILYDNKYIIKSTYLDYDDDKILLGSNNWAELWLTRNVYK